MSKSDPIDSKQQTRRTWVIVAAVLLVVVLTALGKTLGADWISARITPPDVQLLTFQDSGKPVVVFFRSPDCLSCLAVRKNLDAVYPAYKDLVELIDVDVTRKNSRVLVERLGLMTTPTLLFVNSSGEEDLFVGEISQAELTLRLDDLSGGAP